jgi:6-phosphogluconolactonase
MRRLRRRLPTAWAVTSRDSPAPGSRYSINPTSGALALLSGSTVTTGPYVSSFQLVPKTSFAWALSVTNTGNGMGGGPYENSGIYSYSLDSSSGLLTPVAGIPFYTLNATANSPLCPGETGGAGAGVGITSAITLASSGMFGYAASAINVGVWTFTFDPATGALSQVASPITIPSTTAPGVVATLQIDPSGRFAYFSAGNLQGVYAYTIDSNSGALTPVSGNPYAVNATYQVAVMAITN